MAAKSGVVDTSVFKGIADLHAEVLSNDPVVAPAHEVVQDSDLIADYSMPPAHADAAPEHSGDTAATSTEDATAGDTGHAHADLAVADADHAYADVDHAYADVDHAYADHAYADATIPDSAFADPSMLPADAGTPNSLGAEPGKQGDDGHNAAAWWWVGGAAVAAGAIGYWVADDNNDDSTQTSVAASPDVHVVVDSFGAAYIDVNGNGVHDTGEDTLAAFGRGGSADLAANSVTVHFNGMPGDALDLTGFGADDKIEFHMAAMEGTVFDNQASYLTDISIWTSGGTSTYGASYNVHAGFGYASIDVHQCTTSTPTADLNGNIITHAYYIDIGHQTIGTYETAIAYWTDAGNALNDNALLFPNLEASGITAVVNNLNANNEGGLIDFIWPAEVLG